MKKLTIVAAGLVAVGLVAVGLVAVDVIEKKYYNSLTIEEKSGALKTALAKENHISENKIVIDGVRISFHDDVISPKLRSIYKIYRDDSCALTITANAFDMMELREINGLWWLTINKLDQGGDFDFSQLDRFGKLRILQMHGITAKELETLPRLPSVRSISLSTRLICTLPRSFYDKFPALREIRVENMILQYPMPGVKSFHLRGDNSMDSLKYGFTKKHDQLVLERGKIILDEQNLSSVLKCGYVIFQDCDIHILHIPAKTSPFEVHLLDCRIHDGALGARSFDKYDGDLFSLLSKQ